MDTLVPVITYLSDPKVNNESPAPLSLTNRKSASGSDKVVTDKPRFSTCELGNLWIIRVTLNRL